MERPIDILRIVDCLGVLSSSRLAEPGHMENQRRDLIKAVEMQPREPIKDPEEMSHADDFGAAFGFALKDGKPTLTTEATIANLVFNAFIIAKQYDEFRATAFIMSAMATGMCEELELGQKAGLVNPIPNEE